MPSRIRRISRLFLPGTHVRVSPGLSLGCSKTKVPSLTLTRSDIIPPLRISSTKAFEKRLVPALLRLSSSQLPIGSSRKRARRPASPKAVHIVLAHHRAISTAIVVGVVVYGIRLLVEIGRGRGFLEFPTGDFGIQLRVSEIVSIQQSTRCGTRSDSAAYLFPILSCSPRFVLFRYTLLLHIPTLRSVILHKLAKGRVTAVTHLVHLIFRPLVHSQRSDEGQVYPEAYSRENR